MEAKSDGWMTRKLEGGVVVHVRAAPAAGEREPAGPGLFLLPGLVVTGVMIEGDNITSDTLRQIPLARILADAPPGTSLVPGADSETTLGELRARTAIPLRERKRKPLGRPDGKDPDGFYRKFAAAYQSAATGSSKPARTLSIENEVPIETVRRWIKEARRRGHLPRGTKGRAG